jgi:hypothetical protein
MGRLRSYAVCDKPKNRHEFNLRETLPRKAAQPPPKLKPEQPAPPFRRVKNGSANSFTPEVIYPPFLEARCAKSTLDTQGFSLTQI